ncbi:cyclin-domain-containing protein [Dichotomocladium elegans]|nr:cyclin-domain-containing protein [Dichotomocladium elegans]
MPLQMEPVQQYTLFPIGKTTSSFLNLPSSSAFPPFFGHPHLRPPAAKRSSAFEPVWTAPPTQPTFESNTTATIAEYASSILYMMWYGRKKPSSTTWSYATKPYRHSSLVDAAKPGPAFKKFCLQLLAATQLSDNAVYIALKYICLLLRAHPAIDGGEGSEYRLFTVALMLANKFLDDSTFTNKTWSEVSGIKLDDLNTMEAEFLAAVDYRLFVRDFDFHQWKHAVDGCRVYVDRTSMDGYHFHLDELIQLVLSRLGLCETAKDNNKRQYKEVLAQQQRAIWETAAEVSRLQMENMQRQAQLHTYPTAHALETWGPPQTPTLPRRQAAPPPPIGYNGKAFHSPHRRASFASMMLPNADFLFPPIDAARKFDFFQPPEHLDTRPAKRDHYPPGLVDTSTGYPRPISWSYSTIPDAPATPALTPPWCRDFL